MDITTKNYRKAQFDRIKTDNNEYKPKIKIVSSGGETNWLDIEEGELKAIKAILTS